LKNRPKYGFEYVVVGIPEGVYDRMYANLKALNVKLNTEKHRRQEGYVWMNMGLPKTDKNPKAADVFHIMEGDKEFSVPIHEQLRVASGSIMGYLWCELRLKCQTDYAMNTATSQDIAWNIGFAVSEFF
ncbi:hypothetical protein EDD11_001034, partial [Mortierella claussenii]